MNFGDFKAESWAAWAVAAFELFFLDFSLLAQSYYSILFRSCLFGLCLTGLLLLQKANIVYSENT